MFAAIALPPKPTHEHTCLAESRCVPGPTALQLPFAAAQFAGWPNSFQQDSVPSVRPVSYHTLHVGSGQGLAAVATNPYPPDAHMPEEAPLHVTQALEPRWE